MGGHDSSLSDSSTDANCETCKCHDDPLDARLGDDGHAEIDDRRDVDAAEDEEDDTYSLWLRCW